MKKKTPTEKYIDKAVEAAAKEMNSNTISNCNFTNEIKIGDAVETIAEALLENAKALGIVALAIQDTNVTALTIK